MSHLATVRITMPPLAARQEEVKELCSRWLSRPGTPPAQLGRRVQELIASTSWERELDSIQAAIKKVREQPFAQEALQRARILDALELTDGNITEVAKSIGTPQMDLFRYLSRENIELSF